MMYRHANPTPTSRHSAYTLMEVVLAVVVLMIITSLASSPLMRSWRDQRTGSAAEEVRALLAGCRIQALDRDQTWQFAYEPGGTRYVRVPQAASTETTSTGTEHQGKQSGTLPSEITFGESNQGSTSTVSAEILNGLPDAEELKGISWSAPILFYSDGTASEATFEINDEYGGTRTISVRDLTGGVTVTDGSSL